MKQDGHRKPAHNGNASFLRQTEGYVDKAEEYLYSSARDYYYDKNCGLLEIVFITK